MDLKISPLNGGLNVGLLIGGPAHIHLMVCEVIFRVTPEKSIYGKTLNIIVAKWAKVQLPKFYPLGRLESQCNAIEISAPPLRISRNWVTDFLG